MTSGQGPQEAPLDLVSTMRRAADLHGRGAREAAEGLYRKILSVAPDHADALHMLGVLEAQRKNFTKAAELIAKSIAINPENAQAHYNYGNVLRDSGELERALASFDRSLQLQPNQPGTFVNRGAVLHDLGRYDEAVASYDSGLALNPRDSFAHFNRGNALFALKRNEEALASFRHAAQLNPNHAEAHNSCGNVLAALGRGEEALAAFDRALAIWMDKRRGSEHSTPDLAAMQRAIAELMMDAGENDKASRHLKVATKLNPEDETASYFFAALSKGAAPEASPGAYVASLFDTYAENFDNHLVGRLSYRAPGLIAKVVLETLEPAAAGLDIIDLGCGTGLVGPHIKHAAKRLVGVDLSEKMLERAKDRGVYDELRCEELVAALAKYDAAFDVAISADVFVYVGNLEPAFKACARALKPGGLLAFTVEEVEGTGFMLEVTCRYRHSKSYLDELAAAQGFAVVHSEPMVLRYNHNEPVQGRLMILRRN